MPTFLLLFGSALTLSFLSDFTRAVAFLFFGGLTCLAASSFACALEARGRKQLLLKDLYVPIFFH